MFSYRHGFHAGNHADVLKHTVLVQLLEHLTQKDTPFWVVDTHAGGGLYDLAAGYAAKSGEAKGGIHKIWASRKDAVLPRALQDLIEQIEVCNEGDALRWYPGSPQLAAQMLRPRDHLRMYELHPTESRALKAHFADVKRGVSIEVADGFAGLKGILPPPPKRGLVHIDPPYEMKDDYRRVISTLKEALARFPTGVYAVWYPIVARRESDLLPDQLKRLAPGKWLHASLRVKANSRDGLGLNGSGMFIVNPPWTLYETLAEALPWMVENIGIDDHSAYVLESDVK
ncbi:MAG: 23S rRNA (adenine(2030)-N(6))-methyltransferase RlmJ [Pseudomonadota bacterium]